MINLKKPVCKISDPWHLNAEIMKAIIKTEDYGSIHNVIMYASFFLADGLCTQSAHDELIETTKANNPFPYSEWIKK